MEFIKQRQQQQNNVSEGRLLRGAENGLYLNRGGNFTGVYIRSSILKILAFHVSHTSIFFFF